MPEAKTITVATGRTRTELEVHEIHYVLMKRNYANIHMEWGGVCKARITFAELKTLLGEEFFPIGRGCLVSIAQIHHIDDMVVLNSGERLKFLHRLKPALVAQVCAARSCPCSFVRRCCPAPWRGASIASARLSSGRSSALWPIRRTALPRGCAKAFPVRSAGSWRRWRAAPRCRSLPEIAKKDRGKHVQSDESMI